MLGIAAWGIPNKSAGTVVHDNMVSHASIQKHTFFSCDSIPDVNKHELQIQYLFLVWLWKSNTYVELNLNLCNNSYV